MVSCKYPSFILLGAEYCMFISAPGSIFLFYLAVLVSFGSETVYTVPKNRFESSVVLFLASFVSTWMIYHLRSTQHYLPSVTTQNIWPSSDRRTLRDGSMRERSSKSSWRPFNLNSNHNQFRLSPLLLPPHHKCKKAKPHPEEDRSSRLDPEEDRWHNNKQTIDMGTIYMDIIFIAISGNSSTIGSAHRILFLVQKIPSMPHTERRHLT